MPDDPVEAPPEEESLVLAAACELGNVVRN